MDEEMLNGSSLSSQGWRDELNGIAEAGPGPSSQSTRALHPPSTPPPSALLEPSSPGASTSTQAYQPSLYDYPFGLVTPAQSPSARRSSAAISAALASPTRKEPFPLPLDSLLAVGTIVINQHRVRGHPTSEEGEWRALTKTSLETVIVDLPEILEDLIFVEEPEPAPVKIPPSKPLPNKKKRRSSTVAAPSPKKRRFSLVPRSSKDLLHDVLVMQDALNIKATYLSLPGDIVLLRVYLVPADLEELRKGGKTKRGHVAVSTTSTVFSSIRAIGEEWDGKLFEGECPSFCEDQDKRSLLEVYRSLSSPPNEEDFVDTLENTSDEVKDRLRDALAHSPQGMTTDLFAYQNASLAEMLQREIAPQTFDDPSFLQNTDLFGRQYFTSVDGEVYLSVPRKFCEPKGGFLSEDMGTGKTAICIALILSTINELPDLSNTSTFLDGSPSPPPILLTALSRNFPFAPNRSEARKLRPRVVPPLLGYESTNLELEMYFQALHQQELEDRAEAIPPIPSLRDLLLNRLRTTSGRGYSADKDTPDLEGSGLLDELNRLIPHYLVHPSPTQLASREGRKGILTAVEIAVAPTTLVIVPTDLIRQWQGEISKHVDSTAGLRLKVLRTSTDRFPTPAEISKLDMIVMSTSRFSDAANDPKSPLRFVHFKRLVVDEGHAAAGDNRMRKLAEELRCECSWVISGTPTKNLRGGDDQSTLFAMQSLVGGDESDFQRLGQIFSRFLKHPAFAKPEHWRHSITVPALSGRGISRLRQVMDRAFVRNQHDRIAESYTLKPLTSSVVFMEMLPSELKTYNCLIALFKMNAIMAQRLDPDYLFHPQRRKYLDELTLNLSASSFFFASTAFVAWLSGGIKYANESLASIKSHSWAPGDRDALIDIIKRIQDALDDKEWRRVIGSISVLVEIEGLQQDLVKLFNGLLAKDNPREKTVIAPGELVILKRDLKAIRGLEGPPAWEDDEDLMEEVITFEENRRRQASLQSSEQATPKAKVKRSKHNPPPLHPLPEESSFSHITLGRSTSAKANYVVEQLRLHSTEKFLVFSSTLPDLIFAHLSEILDCLRISHVIFAGHGNKRDRGAMAERFNSTSASECQVILIDARLGGRGVHLTAASRVIFLNPIWDPDLEIQSARRAHRLGQTKPVVLEVLVVRDSYEHALLERREQLTQQDISKTKQPQGDPRLREVLQTTNFLEPKDHSGLSQDNFITTLLSPEEGGSTSPQPVMDFYEPEPAELTWENWDDTPPPVRSKLKQVWARTNALVD